MARKDSENQKKSMSLLFRGKAIFKPLNTGWIDEHVACVREWIANIFFYTKNGTTIMIDAGYNYERLREKMSWLDIDPASIRQIFITHQDTDHVGALERDSEQLFQNATVYIGEIENRYLTGEVRRKVFHGAYKLPMVKTDNQKILLKDGEIVQVGDIKIECILVPGHTWGHMVYLVDDEYLFTGDTIWFGDWKRWKRICARENSPSGSSPATQAGQMIWTLPSGTGPRSAALSQRNIRILPRHMTATSRMMTRRKAQGQCRSERLPHNE